MNNACCSLVMAWRVFFSVWRGNSANFTGFRSIRPFRSACLKQPFNTADTILMLESAYPSFTRSLYNF